MLAMRFGFVWVMLFVVVGGAGIEPATPRV